MKYVIDEIEVRYLHSRGLGNRVIADALEVPHFYINRLLPKLGLTTNNPRGKKPQQTEEGNYVCNACKKVLPLGDFALVRSIEDGRRQSICRKCRNNKARAVLNGSDISFWRGRQSMLKRRARNEGRYDLPEDYLYYLNQAQGGRCFYTDAELDCVFGNGRGNYAPSVDRVDCSKGYTVDNIVLAASRINTMKSDATLDEMKIWMPEWHSRIVEEFPSLLIKVNGLLRLEHEKNAAGRLMPSWILERRNSLDEAKEALRQFRVERDNGVEEGQGRAS